MKAQASHIAKNSHHGFLILPYLFTKPTGKDSPTCLIDNSYLDVSMTS